MAMKVAIIPKYMIIKNGKSESKTIQNIFHCYTQAPMQKQEGKMLTATWGKHFFKADATKCASEIMEICDQMESATPQQILEKARDESTELHNRNTESKRKRQISHQPGQCDYHLIW